MIRIGHLYLIALVFETMSYKYFHQRKYIHLILLLAQYIMIIPQKSEQIPIYKHFRILMRQYMYAGSWDNWKTKIKMNKGFDQMLKKQEYYVFLNLELNKTYQYKFFVFDKFIHDHHLPSIQDGLVGFNNRIHIILNKQNNFFLNNSIESISLNNQIQCQWQKIKLGEIDLKSLFGHTMNLINSKLYVFGGIRKGTFSNCFIMYDLKDFELDLIDYYQISQRAYHNSATYGNKIIIYGGLNKEYLRDYYVFNTSDKSWTGHKQGKNQGNYPHKRERNSCLLYNTNLIFFGGYFCSYDQQIQSYYDDLYLLDFLQVHKFYRNNGKQSIQKELNQNLDMDIQQM